MKQCVWMLNTFFSRSGDCLIDVFSLIDVSVTSVSEMIIFPPQDLRKISFQQIES